MGLARGTAVGRYVIAELLGAGAMGEVYRATDPSLGRSVAVKMLAGAHACEASTLLRFEQEARATAALTHPNIVTIHDVGTHEGQPYLVTELLEGKTLREHVEAQPPTPEGIVEIGLQLGRGIAAAHAVKIVHRDLKPDNLFVTLDGTLKILDFGLAKLRPDTPTSPDSATIGTSTPGQLIGTLAYMAPEQLKGQPVDERADIFAIGAVLYELATGRAPFASDNAAETIAAILREEPQPIAGMGNPGLERAIMRCLEKEPGERFQTARDLAFALESALTSPEENPPATKVCLPEHSIAVLPFTDMSPTRDQDYLCEGLAEELINALTHIDGLCIAARSSSFQFSGSGTDIRAAGERLGVATILEGSVRKAGNRLRVNVQLIDVSDGYQRWSQRFDRDLEDVFAIQDEIARSVAESLRGVLSTSERESLRRPETGIESYEYFLRGLQLLHRFNRPSIEGGRQMFERAIELDPGYAPAWAGLADSHSWIFEWWGGDPSQLDEADRASRKALELAPGLAESHASRAFVLVLQRHYDDAAREFEEALAINANHFEALYLYARAAFAHGDIERSAELFRRAGEARREDFQSMILLGQSLRMLGRQEQSRLATEEGVRRAERYLELNPTDPRALSLGANGLANLGRVEQALTWSERAIELHPEEQGVLTNGACLRAKLGMKDEALELLEHVFERGWGKREWIEQDPDYDGIRSDPRFLALLKKLP